MKVIDLLNKIANGEEVPKYVKYINHTSLDTEYTMMVCKENIFYKLDNLEINLNDEVEIIEEPQEHKIPEKLNTWYGIEPVNLDSPTTFKDNAKYIDYNTEMFFDKINEILDYLEEME